MKRPLNSKCPLILIAAYIISLTTTGLAESRDLNLIVSGTIHSLDDFGFEGGEDELGYPIGDVAFLEMSFEESTTVRIDGEDVVQSKPAKLSIRNTPVYPIAVNVAKPSGCKVAGKDIPADDVNVGDNRSGVTKGRKFSLSMFRPLALVVNLSNPPSKNLNKINCENPGVITSKF